MNKNPMKKLAACIAAMSLLVGSACTASASTFTPGSYEGSAQGFGGMVTVKVTVDEQAVTEAQIIADSENSPALGAEALAAYQATLVGVTDAEQVEAVTGATVTSNAVQEALGKALAQASGAVAESAPLAFTPGTYTGTAKGYNADVELSVTFSDTAVTGIEVLSSKETAHVGDVAFDIMIPQILAANGTGVDAVSCATFTSAAVRNAVNDAAQQAACTNLDAFKANTVEVTAQEPVEDTWDVVVVGAGGAGMAAAAQAAQDGNTVLVIEKSASMGGNTIVAGGAFQSVMPYLVWDAANPDAQDGVNPLDGQTYAKVKNDAGRIETLKTILSWSEEPFDGTLDEAHPFVAGNIALNAVRGVHEEYLSTLLALKEEIQAYLAWAQPQLDAGVPETQLTLFSTINLHVFQTYYGGLRPSADGSEWIYSDYDLAKQFIEGGQEIKGWLGEQGSLFSHDEQSTLIGCLWQRENAPVGGVVEDTTYEGADRKWGAYFAVPYNTMMSANEHNALMLRTIAQELMTDETGRVVGVKAVGYDGTEVTAHATKGVILATGGYGANIELVQETNKYWKSEYIADNIGTTNLASLTGDGIVMGQAVGAAVDGMGWTQMMPLGWVDNGNLSRGAGENVIFVNAATGKRYVDESAERDVLSLGAFENGMNEETAKALGLKYVPGIYVEISNFEAGALMGEQPVDVPGRVYYSKTVEEVAEMIGCDAATLRKTIEDYDAYVMGTADSLEVEKLSLRGTVGDVEVDENGKYLPETYKLDKVRMRFLAPSTHHTMGGLVVDVNRHVLNAEGEAIEGLYAAGEVTSGFHAGNRLGGNAITEIIVSGRTAAQAVQADTAE